jgi:hypothetical protein
MSVIEPRTEAGRRLLAHLRDHAPSHQALVNAILAIEAEAAAGPRDEGLREALPGLPALLALDAASFGRVIAERPDVWEILRAALAKASE